LPPVQYHETTALFSPYKPLNGKMVRLQQPYRRHHVPTFPAIAEIKWMHMVCCNCGCTLARKGKLTLLGAPVDPTVEAAPVAVEPIVEETPVALVEPMVFPQGEGDQGSTPLSLLATYKAYKAENPDASWRDCYGAIPNFYPDVRTFSIGMRAMLKDEEASE